METKEEFKIITEFPNYEISNIGNVISINYRGSKGIRKQRKTSIDKDGYEVLNLWDKGITKYRSVHRLVAIAFVPNPNNYKCVNHKDGNKQNNNYSNLEWVTIDMNNKHAIKTGLVNNRGSNNPRATTCREDVYFIRQEYQQLKGTKNWREKLAAKYNITLSCLQDIIYNRTWKNEV